MSKEIKRTYPSWLNGEVKSVQKEYTEPTRLLGDDGIVLSPGWARHNVFDYRRDDARPAWRKKEWDFYQFSDGNLSLVICCSNISVASFIQCSLTDLHNRQNDKKYHTGTFFDNMTISLGGKKYILPPKGDVPCEYEFDFTGLGAPAKFKSVTKETSRELYYKSTFKGEELEVSVQMDIPEGNENITTVLPYKNKPTRYFMTTKQSNMPCEATVKLGDKTWTLNKATAFAFLDWGRVNTPYKMVWYWGNGNHYVYDKDGNKHLFGFEITWGIGDESNATETCIFWDGKAHKFGAVDVEVFPKPDKWMNDWHFVSEDGRFDFVMKPFYDHHGDTNALNIARMHCHQVHGIWSGTAILDDGTKVEVNDMYAFCEYCENKW